LSTPLRSSNTQKIIFKVLCCLPLWLGCNIAGLATRLAFAEVEFRATGAALLAVHFIRKNFFFFSAGIAFTHERFQVLIGLKSGAVLCCIRHCRFSLFKVSSLEIIFCALCPLRGGTIKSTPQGGTIKSPVYRGGELVSYSAIFFAISRP
jgi:hypothetical protein